MIYTKSWFEYGYKKENSTDAYVVGIEYLANKPYGIYYKDLLIYGFKTIASNNIRLKL